MEPVQSQFTGFQREYLWELRIPEMQLLALAWAIPEEAYGWQPAGDARSFSAALVHIAASNLMLLYWTNVRPPEVMALCESAEDNETSRSVEMVHRGQQMEKSITKKPEVIDLLKRTFELLEQSFIENSEDDLAVSRELFGEPTSVRKVYLRMLAHTHEHMGQVVAYARAMGFRMPWPDPITELERRATTAAAH